MSVLDQDQLLYAQKLAQATGLSLAAVAAWCLAEEGPGQTVGYNCLNCLSKALGRSNGFSGVPIKGYSPAGFAEFDNVTDAATEAAWWVNHMSNYAGIRAAAHSAPLAQVNAIAASPWDAGHYGGDGKNIRATLARVIADHIDGSPPVPHLLVKTGKGGRELAKIRLGEGRARTWIADHALELVDTANAENGVELTIVEA